MPPGPPSCDQTTRTTSNRSSRIASSRNFSAKSGLSAEVSAGFSVRRDPVLDGTVELEDDGVVVEQGVDPLGSQPRPDPDLGSGGDPDVAKERPEPGLARRLVPAVGVRQCGAHRRDPCATNEESERTLDAWRRDELRVEGRVRRDESVHRAAEKAGLHDGDRDRHPKPVRRVPHLQPLDCRMDAVPLAGARPAVTGAGQVHAGEVSAPDRYATGRSREWWLEAALPSK